MLNETINTMKNFSIASLPKEDVNGLRFYGSYYSKKNAMLLDGEVVGTTKGNRVTFVPFKKTIGTMIVPLSMFRSLLTASDNGSIHSLI